MRRETPALAAPILVRFEAAAAESPSPATEDDLRILPGNVQRDDAADERRAEMTGASSRAVRFDHYGDRSVLYVTDVPLPSPERGEVVVEGDAHVNLFLLRAGPRGPALT